MGMGTVLVLRKTRQKKVYRHTKMSGDIIWLWSISPFPCLGFNSPLAHDFKLESSMWKGEPHFRKNSLKKSSVISAREVFAGCHPVF